MAHYFTNNENLSHDINKVNTVIHNISYYFYTDNGVFSKGELDFGTELLLKTFEYSCAQEKETLDIGCGCGPIGIYLSKLGFAVDKKYDYILSNPPIRVGKQKLYEIVMNARERLKKNGEIWLVVRKDKGADSLVRDMGNVYNKVDIVEKKKGFYIIKAC